MYLSEHIISISLTFLAVVILILALGKFTLSVLNFSFYRQAKQYFKLFLELVFGVTIVVCFFSIAKTNFATINLFFLLIIGFLVIKDRPKFFVWTKIKIEKKNIITFLILAVVTLLVQCVFLVDISGEIRIADPDYWTYSLISNSLGENGVENRFGSANLYRTELASSISFYHYFELWLCAFISNFNNLTIIVNLMFVTYPLIILISWIGIIAIWENFGKITFIKIIFSLFFLFLQARHLPIYRDFGLDKYVSFIFTTNTSPFSFLGKKLMPLYIFALLSINLIIRKRLIYGLVALSILPIINATTIAIFAVVYCMVCISYFAKWESGKNLIHLLLYNTLFFVTYLLLYKNGSSVKTVELIIPDVDFTLIITSLIQILATFFLYAPFLLFVVFTFNKKQTLNMPLLIIGGLLLLGTSLLSKLIINFDSSQLYANSLIFFNLIIITILISYYEIYKKKYKHIVYSLVIAMTVVNAYFFYVYHTRSGPSSFFYDKGYLNETAEKSNHIKEKKNIGYILSDKRLENINKLSYFFKMIPCSHLRYYAGNNYVLLNNPDKFKKIPPMQYSILGVFHFFIEKQKKEKTFFSVEESRKQFIKEMNIKIVADYGDAECKLPFVLDTIIDPRSKSRVFILDY